MTKMLDNIRGLLVDLDGTVYVGERPIDGALDAIRVLRDRGFSIRFSTNTTTRSHASLQAKLQRMGLEVSLDEMTTAMGFVVGKRAGAPDGSSVTFDLTGDGERLELVCNHLGHCCGAAQHDNPPGLESL